MSNIIEYNAPTLEVKMRLQVPNIGPDEKIAGEVIAQSIDSFRKLAVFGVEVQRHAVILRLRPPDDLTLGQLREMKDKLESQLCEYVRAVTVRF